MIKRILKSKIFWIIVVLLVVGGIASARFFNQEKKVEYVTSDVSRANLIQSVSATGKVKSASEIDLNFKNAGKLEILKVKVGDRVTANQILTQLKASDLAINVRKAQADLAEAQANLAKVKSGATPEDVGVLKAAVAKAQTDLTNAENDLANTEKTYSQNIVNERQNILTDINSALTKANISLQKVYDTLNYKNDAKNFSTSNATLHNQVKDEYADSVAKVDAAQLAYSLAILDSSDEKINQGVDKTAIALNLVSKILDDLTKLFDYVIVTSTLTQSELDTLKTTINTERTTTDASVNTIQGAKNDLASARLNYETKVQAAKDAVETARKNLAKVEADLAFKQAPARSEDVILYEARVAKARADLALAQDRYDETILRAPINGVVTDINVDVGEQTSLSEAAIVMLAEGNYEIEVDIPESDITKIDLQDEAEITLDAFSPEDIFLGVVTTINPAQTEIQDVIYYRVTVSLKPEQSEKIKFLIDKIKPGMTANVDIRTAISQNVLVIPLRAVKEKNGGFAVEILVNNQPMEKTVTLGLRGNDGLVEITSGLEEGDKVITFTRNIK